jgi:membrane protease YdiL (CAAX protease family)
MSPHRKIAAFVALTFVVSIPFWAAGVWTGDRLLPGLPVSALMVAAPAFAAIVLTARTEGDAAVWRLFGRVWGMRRRSLPALAFAASVMPASIFGAWTWMIWDGVAMPASSTSVAAVAGLFTLFWFAGAAEELGWSAYLAGPAQERWGFLGAGLVIGMIWAAWHVIPLLQAERDGSWIAWWASGTVAVRIVTLAVYRWSARSIFSVTTLHAAQNTAWQIFPTNGSHFDPSYAAPIFCAVALVCAAVTLRRPQLRDVGVET